MVTAAIAERVTEPDAVVGIPDEVAEEDAAADQSGSRRRENTMVFEGARVGNKFRLIEPLGDGGMGKVWLARHLGLRRTVALKVLHRSVHAMEDHRRRFEREAVAIGTLSHPGIVEALDFGELEDGRNFLAMELVHGKTLARIVEEEGPLGWRDAVRIVAEVADAIAFAHAHGVLHRDLKPDNLMIEGSDPARGRPRILDLGLARVDGAPGFSLISDQDVALGTANYSPPEQLRGGPTDARSDVYGLAAVLYHAIAGRPPHPGAKLADVVLSQHRRELAPLGKVRPDRSRPRALDSLVHACLAHDPEERVATAAELRDELRRFLAPSRPLPGLRRLLLGAGLVGVGVIVGVASALLLAH